MKTNELTGTALDWAVAKCEGWFDNKFVISFTGASVAWYDTRFDDGREDTLLPGYSTNWSQGGPIIEREKIATAWHLTRWVAWRGVIEHPGPTPLIAGMRAYVASKLGDDVEIPEELI